jgi:predicted alpha/beta hydrolase
LVSSPRNCPPMLCPTHFGPDLSTYLADNVFRAIRAPVLSIGFSDDPIATRRTVDELRRFFPNAAFDVRWYSPRDVGARIGHAGFFTSRFMAALWQPTFDWIDEKLAGAAT